MRVGRLAVGALLTLLTLAILGGGAALVYAGSRGSDRAAAPTRSSIRTLSVICRAPSLGGALRAQVYLPPGYGSAGRRYPVIYFLHGLPAGPASSKSNAFVASALIPTHERAIVVAPEGARSVNSDREYLDWSPTENWPRAITHDLTSCIDRRYHTIAQRSGRTLIGLSAGGYGALNIGLRNLQTFGAVESWSGYVAATDPSGYHVLKFATPSSPRQAAVPEDAELRVDLARYPSLLAFYCGRADDRFADTNERFDATLTRGAVKHVYRTYPGGHSNTLWSAEASAWLKMALNYLSSSRTRPQEAG
jgi:putative tributyrin esterase